MKTPEDGKPAQVAGEMAGLERDIAQLERAINNPNLAASVRGIAENKMALERIAKNRMRLAELQTK
jgi:hypothetical protein